MEKERENFTPVCLFVPPNAQIGPPKLLHIAEANEHFNSRKGNLLVQKTTFIKFFSFGNFVVWMRKKTKKAYKMERIEQNIEQNIAKY